MPEWFLVVIGILAALAILSGVFAIAFMPRDRKARSRLAPRSGREEYDSIAGESEPAHHSGDAGD